MITGVILTCTCYDVYFTNSHAIFPASRDPFAGRLWLAFLFCLLPGLAALAQTISGRVTSADDNQPLPGVSILVKGTATGTTTLADGTYSVRAPQNATLTFSFIGYETKEIPVGNAHGN